MAMAAKYRNNGQVCISPSRFYIHESKKKKFTESFVSKTLNLRTVESEIAKSLENVQKIHH